jgi:hypothetical protein
MLILQQVNGEDVSACSHEEAVAAFQSASEPIVVEVLRRTDGPPAMRTRPPPRPPSPPMEDATTQTEEYIESAYFDLYGYSLGSVSTLLQSHNSGNN